MKQKRQPEQLIFVKSPSLSDEEWERRKRRMSDIGLGYVLGDLDPALDVSRKRTIVCDRRWSSKAGERIVTKTVPLIWDEVREDTDQQDFEVDPSEQDTEERMPWEPDDHEDQRLYDDEEDQ